MYRLQPTFAVLLALLGAPAAAAEPPASDAANRTIEYYYSDAQRPVLMAFRVCRDVHEEGDNRHDCTQAIDTATLTEGSEIVLWMKFLVPRDAAPKILMQVDQDGITRDTFERTLSGAIRYRTWNRVQLSRDGTWQVRVFRETEDEVHELHAATLEVAPATSNSGNGSNAAAQQ